MPARDDIADSHCVTRPSSKLTRSDLAGRSAQPQEQWEWGKVLGAAAESARLRAVHLHFTTLFEATALPLVTNGACNPLHAPSSTVEHPGLHMDECEGAWIYDTGAAVCFIWCGYLMDRTKKTMVNVAPIAPATAAWLPSTNKTVICNGSSIPKRHWYVFPDSLPATSVE